MSAKQHLKQLKTWTQRNILLHHKVSVCAKLCVIIFCCLLMIGDLTLHTSLIRLYEQPTSRWKRNRWVTEHLLFRWHLFQPVVSQYLQSSSQTHRIIFNISLWKTVNRTFFDYTKLCKTFCSHCKQQTRCFGIAIYTIFSCVNKVRKPRDAAEDSSWRLWVDFELRIFCKTKQVEFIEKHFTHCHSIVSVLDRCGGWGEPFPLVRMCQTQVTEAGFVSRC